MSNSAQKNHRYPIVAVGAVVIHEGKILLVKRGKPPSQNLWAIPGGKIRHGESMQSAAEREILEETGLTVKATQPVHVFDLIQRNNNKIEFHYVIVDLLTSYVTGQAHAAGDASDAGWFSPDELPDSLDKNTHEFISAHLALFI